MNRSDMVHAWRLWRQWVGGAAEDTIGSYGPDDKPTTGLIGVGGCRAIALRIFGKDADNETGTITIIGWNNNGPGQVLWQGQVILGATVFDEKVIPGTVVAAGNWFEVDTYDSSGGSNACGAQVFDGGAQALLMVPTLGYTDLDIRATDKDGSTGSEAATLCAIYRTHDAMLVV